MTFLLTWRDQLPDQLQRDAADLVALSQAICHRHTGAGADGWILIAKADNATASIDLWNSDGSRSEISGNGTRCAAALLVASGKATEDVRIATGAGIKSLRLLDRQDHLYSFEMNMGQAVVEELHATLVPGRECVILNVGNPQCALFTSNFDFDWQKLGSELERHPRFPNRTNVSFIRMVDDHTLDVRFFERGAGETMSSGTGSTGAAAAALARGWVSSPVHVQTPAGPLELRLENDDIYLQGPAEIVAEGKFYYEYERGRD